MTIAQSKVTSIANVSNSDANRGARTRQLIQQNGLLVAFVLMVGVVAVIKPVFLSEANIRNILENASLIGIMACGQTVVILTGGFDLSVGRIAVVSSLLLVVCSPLGAIPAVLLAIGGGTLIGLANGTLISRARVNPFVVTLGMYTILGSVALLISNGTTLADVPQWAISLTSGTVFGASTIVLWFIGVAIGCHVLLSRTRYGQQIYAVGGNYEASRMAGIRVDLVLTFAYVLIGALAGMAGILLASKLRAASPVALPGAELQVIAAVIIGGTKLSGGFGSIPRTIMGVLILTSMSSALVILGVATYWQGVLQGAVIIAAVAVDVLFSRRN